ncbi:PEBP-like protein [Tothia fuscella]|uniref:PEBP-like protein n=1 Tax=Tothia fuscella TaxID=1048955 RepID=A0A9P4TVA4_9PEZI|nr:PEBP-like protein [Tothia fuscella]
MILTARTCALVAALSANVRAQTPQDFMPGSLVRLGVAYKGVNIDPAGTDVGPLDLVNTQPTVTIPAAMLTDAQGQVQPDRRFMIFMIDMDVIQNGVATTVLHWYQPDLVMQPNPAAMAAAMPNGVIPPTMPMVLTVDGGDNSRAITGEALPAGPNGQAAYFGPGPPPGPPHRYVQVLFAQPRNFSTPSCFSNIVSAPDMPPDVQGRVGFDISQFLVAAKVNPRPLAGNYFRAQNPMPGSLEQNANAMALRNNMCAGAPIAAGVGAMPPPPGAAKKRSVKRAAWSAKTRWFA